MSGLNDRQGLPDEALVKAAQSGQMEAFEELVARHRDKMFARAYSIVHNEEQALDLSQEAWIKAWQRLDQFQGESSFTTWMTRITINLCLDQLRRQQRYRVEPLPEAADDPDAWEKLLPAVWTNPTAGLERRELRIAIEAALAKLTEAHRTVLVLHEFEGMEYKEIAKVVGISVGTVMSRLFYARRRMAGLLAGTIKEDHPS
jgi:RNA polymerase sigma-70 factor, ECF subfamily